VEEPESGMQQVEGKSFTDIFYTGRKGFTFKDRKHVIIGQERHDVGRPDDSGYPVRGIIKDGFLYLKNYKPGRWPAGNPETGYLNCDGSPTKTLILMMRRTGTSSDYWNLGFGTDFEEIR